MHDAKLRRISVANAVLSGVTPDFREIKCQVRNQGDHIDTIACYMDIIPPGGLSNPGGCLPNGRILQASVTLDPTGVAFPRQANLFAQSGSQPGQVEFSCTNVTAVIGQRFTIIAVADHGADDLASCPAGALLSLACFNGLILPLGVDDSDPSDNRRSRNAPKVKNPDPGD